MRAWRVEELGGIGSLALREVPSPEPTSGEMRVAVAAAALNFSDLLMLSGSYQIKPPLPFTPGQEVSGTVEACPSGAFRAGERVAAKVVWGGFGERALVRDDMAIRLPDTVDYAGAATLPVVWPTAWIALFERACLQAGETLLVLAAAGGTGLAAVQLGKAAGAKVVAAAGSAAKLAVCRAHGADLGIDYSQAGWFDTLSQADVIFDPVGGEMTEAAFKRLARGGRLLIVGFSSGQIPALHANRLLLKSASALGVYWSHEHDRALLERAFADLWRRHAAGELRFEASQRFPFEALPAALTDLAQRKTHGKCVVTIP